MMTKRMIRMGVCLACVLAVTLAASAQPARRSGRSRTRRKIDAPPETQKAMQELWRRGTCLLSSVHKPAEKDSAVPGDIGTTPVLNPRLRTWRGEVNCYAVDGGTLWAADDQCLLRIDAATAKVTRTFDRRDGLPDEVIQSIAPAGGTVWLATRAGLAGLDVKTGRISLVVEQALELARLAAGDGGVWLVSDAGAWRLPTGEKKWRKLPDPPPLAGLKQMARRGFWAVRWARRLRVNVPSMFAREDGLYVVVMNKLLRCGSAAGKWEQIGADVWQAASAGKAVWAMTTKGVLRYEPATGKTVRHESGKGPAAGRPAAMAATDEAFFLASQPDYDKDAKRFVGGGISRLDVASGKWTIIEQVDGTDIRFLSAVTVDGAEAWAACTLYDRVVEQGAHPGMAHVKRWRPHASGMGLLHYREGKWTLRKREGLKTEKRWVLGQKGTGQADRIGPDSAEMLRRFDDGVWGAYRMVPDRYYAGYYVSAGRLARRGGDGQWQAGFGVRTAQLGMGGEQPSILLISHSHGARIVLAEGHPIVLGIEQVGGRVWVINSAGLFARDAKTDEFRPVHRATPRLYWRATAAAAVSDAIWFGGDGGTVSRLDRATGRLELVGVAAGRKVTAIVPGSGGVLVKTDKANVVLPVSLASAAELPDGAVLGFDGKKWTGGAGQISGKALAYECKSVRGRGRRADYLGKGKDRLGFLKGVFRSKVLCVDEAGGQVWLSAYSGVASVALPGAAGK